MLLRTARAPSRFSGLLASRQITRSGSSVVATPPSSVIPAAVTNALPVQTLTAKELQLRGSFRFHGEFFTGVEMMRKRLIDVKPLITQTVPLDAAEEGFRIASDRSRAMKAQIDFLN